MFFDQNPDCPADARYKAIVRSHKPKGLLVMKSADGIHWSPLSEKPVITDGAFDSQNLAFWDPLRKEYRAYWPIISNKNRYILTETKKDIKTTTPQRELHYREAPTQKLYDNHNMHYNREPHLIIGFPTRYVDRGWKSPSMEALPDLEHRRQRSVASERYGTAVTEGLFMISRDAVNFHRWPEAFLRPGP